MEQTKNLFSLKPKEYLIVHSCFIGVCLIVGIITVGIFKQPLAIAMLIVIGLILLSIPFFRLKSYVKNKSLGD